MLQVAGRGYAEFLRKPIRRGSEVRYTPARWDTTAAGSAATLKRVWVSYVRADHEVLYSVHKKLTIPLTSKIILTLSLTKQALRTRDHSCGGIGLVVRSSTHSLGMGIGILAVATHDGRLGTPLSGVLGRGISRGKLDRGGLWCVPSGERTDRAASNRALKR